MLLFQSEAVRVILDELATAFANGILVCIGVLCTFSAVVIPSNVNVLIALINRVSATFASGENRGLRCVRASWVAWVLSANFTHGKNLLCILFLYVNIVLHDNIIPEIE